MERYSQEQLDLLELGKRVRYWIHAENFGSRWFEGIRRWSIEDRAEEAGWR